MIRPKNVSSSLKMVREELFTRLYLQCFPTVAAMVSKSGGNLEDAREIFQQGLLVFYEKSLEDSASAEVRDEGAYLFGICRFLWFKDRREQAKHSDVEHHLFQIKEEEESLPNQAKIMTYLEKAGKKCMEILKSFYYDKASATELKERFGFSSERSATVQKYKCLEKVRSVVKEKSMNYEDFLH